MQVGLGPGHIVLVGDPVPRRGIAPQFLAHICCGQMAAWIKMPLGMELGLGPGNCVRWGTTPPPQKGVGPNNFPLMFIVAKRLDGTWHGDRYVVPQP